MATAGAREKVLFIACVFFPRVRVDTCDFQCPVCHREASEDQPIDVHGMPGCGHGICRECVIDFLIHCCYSRCPVCRAPVGNELRIYDLLWQSGIYDDADIELD